MVDWRDERDLAIAELQNAKAEDEQALEHLREAGLHVANAIEALEGAS